MKKIILSDNSISNNEKKLMSIIDETLSSFRVSSIKSNSLIISIIKEFNNFEKSNEDASKIKFSTNKYLVGKYKNIDVYLDPNMNWNDTKMIFYKDEYEICEEIIIHIDGKLI